jgi:hypothetical protein
MTIRIFCGNCGNLATTISDRLTAANIPHELNETGTIEATAHNLSDIKAIVTRYQVPALQSITPGVFAAI